MTMRVPETGDHALPGVCPKCGYKIDAAGNMPGETQRPGPGDLSICLDCTAVLRFDASMTLKAMTSTEILRLPHETQSEIAHTRLAIQHVKKQN